MHYVAPVLADVVSCLIMMITIKYPCHRHISVLPNTQTLDENQRGSHFEEEAMPPGYSKELDRSSGNVIPSLRRIGLNLWYHCSSCCHCCVGVWAPAGPLREYDSFSRISHKEWLAQAHERVRLALQSREYLSLAPRMTDLPPIIDSTMEW